MKTSAHIAPPHPGPRKPAIPTALSAHDKRRLRLSNAQHRPAGVEVWHLVGPQGSARSLYAARFAESLPSGSCVKVIELDGDAISVHRNEFASLCGNADLVMLTHTGVAAGEQPPFFFEGDRFIRFPFPPDVDAIVKSARADAAKFAAGRAKGGSQ